MNKIYAFAIFILFHQTVFSQIDHLNGLVVDASNKLAIENATIKINGEKQMLSDSYGNFNLEKLKPGNYKLEISHIGYSTVVLPITIPSEKKDIRIELTKEAFTLNNITVTGKNTNHYNKISAIDLTLRPINSSQDILRTVPGLFIAQHAGGGKAEQIFLRGFDIDHGTDISITVDGMPVNMISHAHGQGYADLHFLNPETIEKVTFDKGPYNAEKGNLTTAGYVDFKTKDFLEKNTIKIEAGILNTKKISGLVKVFGKNRDNNKSQFYIASEVIHSDGYFESPQNFNRFNFMGKYSFTKNNSKFNILASTFNSKWNASGQVPERAIENNSITRFGSIDNTEGGNTSRTNIAFNYSKKLSNNWDITQQGYYTNYNFNLFSNFTFYLNNPTDGDMINQHEKRNIYGYTTKLKVNNYLGAKKVVTTFGIGFRYDNIGIISLSNAPKRIFKNYIQQGSIKELNSFAYLNESVELSNKLQVNASLRLDNFNFGYKNILKDDKDFKNINQTVASPKLNINYDVNHKVSLFISNGIGFHSNDARIILADSIKNVLPKVFGTDFGITLKPTKNLYFKTILWHLVSQQEFVYVGDAGVVEAGGKSRRLGIDFITRWQINKTLFADIDISLAKPRSIDEVKGQNYIPLAPTFTSIGGITAKIDNKFSASIRYRFMGNRSANEDYSLTAKGYFLADAVANYKLKNIDFNIAFENILNSKWKEAQFETTTRLQNESSEITEIHFTPGTPFFIKAGVNLSF